MMEIKKILELALEKWDEISSPYTCDKCFALWRRDLITHEEYMDTKRYIQENRPSSTLHPEFFKHKDFNVSDNFTWWCATKSSTQQRKIFVQKLIDQLK